MTYGDVMAQILSEASGKPVSTTKELVAMMASVAPDKFAQEIPEAEMAGLLQKLRGELPGIRGWLEQGAAEFDRELRSAKKH